jgi:hypothetical protein
MALGIPAAVTPKRAALEPDHGPVAGSIDGAQRESCMNEHVRFSFRHLAWQEVLALKWMDIDWKALMIYVRRAIVLGRVDETKTEYSEAPAPLDSSLLESLLEWRRKSEFSDDEDSIFASPFSAERSLISRPQFERKCLLRYRERA